MTRVILIIEQFLVMHRKSIIQDLIIYFLQVMSSILKEDMLIGEYVSASTLTHCIKQNCKRKYSGGEYSKIFCNIYTRWIYCESGSFDCTTKTWIARKNIKGKIGERNRSNTKRICWCIIDCFKVYLTSNIYRRLNINM